MTNSPSAAAQIRAALEPLLAPHGFAYDEVNNADVNPDRPWMLFHADPPGHLATRHPGYAVHLASRYQVDAPTCLDLWVGDRCQDGPHDWCIEGDIDGDELDATALRAARGGPLDVWLPVARRALADWFASIDERHPPPDGTR